MNGAEPLRDWSDVFSLARLMPFTAFSTGTIYGALKNYVQTDSLPVACNARCPRYRYAVMVFHFRHPLNGDVLIDTGFDRSFHDKPPYGNLSLAMKVFLKLHGIRYTQRPGEDLGSQLCRYDIHPRHVFLTHLHADHTAGLPALPNTCDVYYGKRENTAYYRHLATGSHLAGKRNLHLVDFDRALALAPFHRVLNVFGDGSLWALSTPGHTKDHVSYLVNRLPRPVLITGDAELSGWGQGEGVFMNSDYSPDGKSDARRSAETIRRFHAMYPRAQLCFSHDELST